MSIAHRALPVRAATVAVASTLIVITLLALSPGKVEAATLTACVNKKSGVMKLVSGKKAKAPCPRGWRKIRWNTNGPPAKVPQVRSANGAFVGELLGVFPGVAEIFVVKRGGGIYYYAAGGQLLSFASPAFKDSQCAGSAFIAYGSTAIGPAQSLIGGGFRVVFRTRGPEAFGPASAWKSAGSSEVVTDSTLYRRTQSGTCEPEPDLYSGALFRLKPINAPPDFKGPLRIRP